MDGWRSWIGGFGFNDGKSKFPPVVLRARVRSISLGIYEEYLWRASCGVDVKGRIQQDSRSDERSVARARFSWEALQVCKGKWGACLFQCSDPLNHCDCRRHRTRLMAVELTSIRPCSSARESKALQPTSAPHKILAYLLNRGKLHDQHVSI